MKIPVLILFFSTLLASASPSLWSGQPLHAGQDLTASDSVSADWPIDFLVTFGAGNPGDVMTTNYLEASSFGNIGGYWQTSITNFSVQKTLVNGKVGATNFTLPYNYSIGGTLYNGAGTRSMQWDFNTDWATTWESIFRILPVNTISNMTVSMCFLYQPSGGLADQDIASMTYDGSHWVIAEVHCNDDGTVDIKMHGQTNGVSTTGSPLRFSTNTVFIVSIRPNAALMEGEGVLQVLATGELIGCFRCPALTTGFMSYIGFQTYLQFPTNGCMIIDNFAAGINANSRLPLGPITVPQPGNVAANQITSNSIALTWEPDNCLRYSISRYNVESNAWSTVTNNCEGAAFTDTGLTASNSYYYSVSGIIGENQSLFSTNSATVLVNPSIGGGAVTVFVEQTSGPNDLDYCNANSASQKIKNTSVGSVRIPKVDWMLAGVSGGTFHVTITSGHNNTGTAYGGASDTFTVLSTDGAQFYTANWFSSPTVPAGTDFFINLVRESGDCYVDMFYGDGTAYEDSAYGYWNVAGTNQGANKDAIFKVYHQ